MAYGDEGYEGPECSACGGIAEYVEKFNTKVNEHGQVVTYWALECPECGHVERVRTTGVIA